MFTGSILQLTSKYREGSLTPLDHIKNELAKLSTINTHINPIAELIPEDIILTQAIESTKRYKNKSPLGIFDGVPITVKDSVLCEFKGKKLSMGSMINYLDNNGGLFPLPLETSPQIKMLTDLGAIILCITTTPELGHKATTSSFQYGITRNPHNLILSPGGSSGGSAALISLNIGNISIGSDGGGSIRIPSSWCGIFGFKPSYNIGCCNTYLSPYIGVCGPMSLYIDDIRLYMEYLCKQKNDYYPINNLKLDWSLQYMKSGINNLNIAVSKNYDGLIDFVDNKIWKHILNVVKYLKSKLNVNITFIEPPLSEINKIFATDYYKSFCKFWYLYGIFYGEYIENYDKGNKKYMVDPGLIEIIKRSQIMSVKELFIANRVRDKVIQIMTNFHKKYDLLITPTTPILPINARAYNDDMFMINKITNKKIKTLDCYHNNAMFTCLCNLTFQPAISMNIGYEKTKYGKIPIGMQIIGRNNQDNMIIRAAYSIQQHFKPLVAKL